MIQIQLLNNASHEVGLILFGSEETSNLLAERHKGQYENVQVTRTIQKVDLNFYRNLNNFEASTKPTGADFIDGLTVALDMIERHCGTKKY